MNTADLRKDFEALATLASRVAENYCCDEKYYADADRALTSLSSTAASIHRLSASLKNDIDGRIIARAENRKGATS